MMACWDSVSSSRPFSKVLAIGGTCSARAYVETWELFRERVSEPLEVQCLALDDALELLDLDVENGVLPREEPSIDDLPPAHQMLLLYLDRVRILPQKARLALGALYALDIDFVVFVVQIDGLDLKLA